MWLGLDGLYVYGGSMSGDEASSLRCCILLSQNDGHRGKSGCVSFS